MNTAIVHRFPNEYYITRFNADGEPCELFKSTKIEYIREDINDAFTKKDKHYRFIIEKAGKVVEVIDS